MKIYNSLSKKIETFEPLHENIVNMYVCGPTVYNYIHIGNARPVIFFDVVRRYFEHIGYTVHFVSNFTDVDDKIIVKALEDEQSERDVAEKFIKAFYEDVARLGSSTRYLAPRVTEYMSAIIDYIDRLVQAGHAYVVEGDVYFRIAHAKGYGQLSGRKTEELESGSRIAINTRKEDPLDFTLWKKTEVGVTYPSPWGEGRPGWHTECVAMIEDIFGGEIDIHGGGVDLKFPHHENEMAQNEALHKRSLARYWMHNGHLDFGDKKMSKSEGNVILVKELGLDTMGFRLFTLGNHYRSPITYTDATLEHYVNEWKKIKRAYAQSFYALDLAEYLDESVQSFAEVDAISRRFMAAMDDDFNTPNAMTELQNLTKYANQCLRGKQDLDALLAAVRLFETFFAILGLNPDVERMSKATRNIYLAWTDARKNKQFEKADRLREQLVEKGIFA